MCQKKKTKFAHHKISEQVESLKLDTEYFKFLVSEFPHIIADGCFHQVLMIPGMVSKARWFQKPQYLFCDSGE